MTTLNLPTDRLIEADKKYWHPLPAVLTAIERRVPVGARVLEIGPGDLPFSRATQFCGWVPSSTVAPERFVKCDIQTTELPFPNKSFDFVYCRHVLEDLYDPFFIAQEMSRVAKAGYVEAPSPLAEVCRGIDGGSPPWRGYHHHRYFVWSSNDTLNAMGKYPIVEHLGMQDAHLISLLRREPVLWNSYHVWDGELRIRHWQHDIDFQIASQSYGDRIRAAITEGIESSRKFLVDVVKSDTSN